MAVQLNLMVLRHNTEFRLAPLRSVEQVSGLKKKMNASGEDYDLA